MLTIPSNNIPKTPTAAVADAVPYEKTAYGHWQFDTGDSDGLTSLKGDKSLSVVGSAPTYNASSISLSGTAGNGLVSDLADRQVYTAAGVVKWQNALFYAFNSRPATTSGSGLLLSASSANEGRIDMRGTTPATLTLNTSVDPADDLWLFFAMSFDVTGTDNAISVLLGGFGEVSFDSGDVTGAQTVNGANFLGVGSPYGSANNGYDMASFMLWDSALTPAQMRAVMRRELVRQRRMGREVVRSPKV